MMEDKMMNIVVDDIYKKVIRDNNITDKKIIDILSKEANYFNSHINSHYFDELNDYELYDYIYKNLSCTAKNKEVI